MQEWKGRKGLEKRATPKWWTRVKGHARFLVGGRLTSQNTALHEAGFGEKVEVGFTLNRDHQSTSDSAAVIPRGGIERDGAA